MNALFSLDIETSGLHSEPDFLTCIGVASEHGIHQQASPDPRNFEKEMLEDFSDWLDVHPPITFITYNGLGFDVPFITARAKENDVSLPEDKLSSQIDLSLFAKRLNRTYIGKDMFITKYLNLYVPRTCSGAWLARQYSRGPVSPDVHFQNLTHNAIDLGVTLRAYEELLSFPDFNEWLKNPQVKDE